MSLAINQTSWPAAGEVVTNQAEATNDQHAGTVGSDLPTRTYSGARDPIDELVSPAIRHVGHPNTGLADKRVRHLHLHVNRHFQVEVYVRLACAHRGR